MLAGMLHRSRAPLATVLLVLASLPLAACGGTPSPSAPQAPKIYEEFDVTRVGAETCLAKTRATWECPPGGTCQGPPPKPVACPAGLAEGATVHLIMAEDLTCSVNGATTPCPEHDTGEVQVPPGE